MENCTSCGEKRKGNEKFCVGCGSPLSVQTEKVKFEKVKTENRKSSITSTQKKFRIAGVLSVAVILIGLFGAHLFFDSKYDVSQTLINMNQTYTSGNQSEFLSYFNVEENIVIDKEGFYSYVENEGWENIRDQMKMEVDRIETEGLSNIILDSQGNKLISVLNEPVLFGLYDQVSFLVHPITVAAELPMDGTTIALEELEKAGDEGAQVELGRFLPGSYEWTAEIASDFSDVKGAGNVEVRGDGDNRYMFNPTVEAAMIEVTSDVQDAILWVDGKSTEKTVKEMGSFGPVALDGSVEVTAETKDETGKSVKGEPLFIESDSIHIEFAHVQEKVAAERTKELEEKKQLQLAEQHQTNIRDFIDSYRYSFEDALNYADFSYIEDYFPTGSTVQEEYLGEIKRHSSLNTSYDYDFRSNTLTGFEVIDETTFLVTTAEMFYFYSQEDSLKYNKTKSYTVTFQNDQYYITSIDQLTSDKVQM